MHIERLKLICTSDTCINNFYNMRALLQPYTRLKSISQGVYLRDTEGINKMSKIIKLLKNKLEFQFDYLYINLKTSNIEKNVHIIDDSIFEMKKTTQNIYEKNKDTDKIVFLHIGIPGHVNTHIIVCNKDPIIKNKVYIYEPHHPQPDLDKQSYAYEKQYREMYKVANYEIKSLPQYILGQTQLPLCYMYVIHFFLLILLFKDHEQILYDASHKYDDIFTRDIFKLVNEYGLIEDDLIYYLLTNNTYWVQHLLQVDKHREKNQRKYETLNIQHIYYITSLEMVDVLINEKIKFNTKCRDDYILTPNSIKPDDVRDDNAY